MLRFYSLKLTHPRKKENTHTHTQKKQQQPQQNQQTTTKKQQPNNPSCLLFPQP